MKKAMLRLDLAFEDVLEAKMASMTFVWKNLDGFLVFCQQAQKPIETYIFLLFK